ncbi:tetratricopeptide repeat protein 38 [Iris pallida]|uniref:Tetratricopeptide repeat protein 38 n=1 Tax=Iris pallida TaxID=29817 RepID=A0AAX6FPE2_IRIPA|nr:tetratricopeptide repeat protein 38 [Iris pallida]
MGDEEEKGMRSDRWGYPVRTGSAECVAAIGSYYDEVLSYGRRRSVILRARSLDPACVLANALAAHFLARADPAGASSFLAAAAASLENGSGYEKAVFRAVSCLVGEGRDEAAAIQRHFELLKEYPKDLVSLNRAQVICFYSGRPDLSLSLVEQALPKNQDEGYIYGMLAFPLLELGKMAEAERAARKGYEINRLDVWSQHNLCHVFQYECRFKEAVDFMESCSSTWNSCSSFMYTHNWWHVAVCYLEGDSPLHKVLEVYDHYIWKELERPDADAGEVYTNALGLLLRLSVRDHMDFIEDRLLILANIFQNESTWHMEWLSDILALWALASKNDSRKADDLLKSMKLRIYLMDKKKQHSLERATKLADGIYEYGRGNYQKAFAMLGSDFDAIDYKVIGASDEQLDVFNEVWYDVLLKSGQASKAIEVIGKVVKKREGAPFLWRLLEKAYSMEGMAEAQVAAKKAKELEGTYFK